MDSEFVISRSIMINMSKSTWLLSRICISRYIHIYNIRVYIYIYTYNYTHTYVYIYIYKYVLHTHTVITYNCGLIFCPIFIVHLQFQQICLASWCNPWVKPAAWCSSGLPRLRANLFGPFLVEKNPRHIFLGQFWTDLHGVHGCSWMFLLQALDLGYLLVSCTAHPWPDATAKTT